MEPNSSTSQDVTKILQDAQPVKSQEQAAEQQRREEMRAVMAEMKTTRERVGNFYATLPADPNVPSSQEAMVLPLSQSHEDRSQRVNEWGQGKLSERTIVISENGYEYHESRDPSTFGLYFGQEEIPPLKPGRLVYRNFTDAEAVINPISNDRLVGHVLWVAGTNYGSRLHQASTEDVTNALKNNIHNIQLRHQPGLERAQTDISTSQAVKQTLGNTTT